MRDIVRLLFGHDAGKLLDQASRDDDRPGWDEGFGLADRARRSGEWCGSTPGHGSADRAARGRPRR